MLFLRDSSWIFNDGPGGPAHTIRDVFIQGFGRVPAVGGDVEGGRLSTTLNKVGLRGASNKLSIGPDGVFVSHRHHPTHPSVNSWERFQMQSMCGTLPISPGQDEPPAPGA